MCQLGCSQSLWKCQKTKRVWAVEIEVNEVPCQVLGLARQHVSVVLTGNRVSWSDPRDNKEILAKPFGTRSRITSVRASARGTCV